MIDTKALGPSARGSGRRSNFSISGKLMSTWGSPDARRSRSSSGRRCSVCGPNTRSTYGARFTIASPSWLATQPPTPISTGRSPCLRDFQRPSWLNTFSCAFSRIEQVLTRITSASSTFVVSSSPSEAASTSAMRAESYSFIWQPWVGMNNLRAGGAGASDAEAGGVWVVMVVPGHGGESGPDCRCGGVSLNPSAPPGALRTTVLVAVILQWLARRTLAGDAAGGRFPGHGHGFSPWQGRLKHGDCARWRGGDEVLRKNHRVRLRGDGRPCLHGSGRPGRGWHHLPLRRGRRRGELC